MSEPWKCGHTQPMIMCNICVANLESQFRAAEKTIEERGHEFQKSTQELLVQLKAADELAKASEKAKNWIQPIMEGFDISKTSPAIVEVLNPLLKALSEYKKARRR